MFILNACLSVVATLASVTMIKHKELTRGDEVALKEDARHKEKAPEGLEGSLKGRGPAASTVGDDVELGDMTLDHVRVQDKVETK